MYNIYIYIYKLTGGAATPKGGGRPAFTAAGGKVASLYIYIYIYIYTCISYLSMYI